MNFATVNSAIPAAFITGVVCVAPSFADSFLVPAGGDIQAVIDIAASGDVLQLEAGTYQPANAIRTDGKAITIRGAAGKGGVPLSVIDAQEGHRVFLIENDTGTVVMENLQVVNGVPSQAELGADGSGGGICVVGTTGMSIRNCWFTGNDGAFIGQVVRPDFEFVDCVFSGNTGVFASAIGYFVGQGQSSMTIEGCRFDSNASVQHTVVAAFMPEGHQFTVSDCEFTGNSGNSILLVDGPEAGSVSDLPSLTLAGVTSSGNNVDRTVGWGAGDLTIRDSTFDGQGTGLGVTGGLSPMARPGDLLIQDSSFRRHEFGAISYPHPIGSVDVQRTAFRSNTGPGFSLGSSNLDPAGVFFTDCVFTDNVSGGAGAVSLQSTGTFVGCGWAGNAAISGAAIEGPKVVLDDCLFNENSSGDNGSNIKVGILEATDCEFTNNASSADGGAVHIGGDLGESVLQDCFFFRNFATTGIGGGLALSGGASAEVVDCIFERNDAAFLGGGISCESSGSLLVDGCDLIDNFSLLGGGGVYSNGRLSTSIKDTLFCRNTLEQIMANFTDLGGNTLINFGSCETIIGDFDGNLVVDGGDLAVVLGSWGPCTADPCQADLNGDQQVNGADLALILAAWGPVDP